MAGRAAKLLSFAMKKKKKREKREKLPGGFPRSRAARKSFLHTGLPAGGEATAPPSLYYSFVPFFSSEFPDEFLPPNCLRYLVSTCDSLLVHRFLSEFVRFCLSFRYISFYSRYFAIVNSWFNFFLLIFYVGNVARLAYYNIYICTSQFFQINVIPIYYRSSCFIVLSSSTETYNKTKLLTHYTLLHYNNSYLISP